MNEDLRAKAIEALEANEPIGIVVGRVELVLKPEAAERIRRRLLQELRWEIEQERQ